GSGPRFFARYSRSRCHPFLLVPQKRAPVFLNRYCCPVFLVWRLLCLMPHAGADTGHRGEAELLAEFRERGAGVLELEPERVPDEVAASAPEDLAGVLDQGLEFKPVGPGAAVADEQCPV